MAGDLVVKLIDPVETVSGHVTEAVFREPRGRDFMELGSPFQAAQVNGGLMVIEKDEAIRAYMERCVKAPLDPVTLDGMTLPNIMACREKFLGFFDSARARIMAASSTSSSST